MSTLFKMKGFSGFGNSPIKQVTGAHGTEATEHWKKYQASKVTDSGVTEATTKKAVIEGSKKGLKTTAKKIISERAKDILKTGSRFLGGIGVLSSLYGMYKSGQKHSGGKAVLKPKATKFSGGKTWSQAMDEGRKKTKSIWNK